MEGPQNVLPFSDFSHVRTPGWGKWHAKLSSMCLLWKIQNWFCSLCERTILSCITCKCGANQETIHRLGTFHPATWQTQSCSPAVFLQKECKINQIISVDPTLLCSFFSKKASGPPAGTTTSRSLRNELRRWRLLRWDWTNASANFPHFVTNCIHESRQKNKIQDLSIKEIVNRTYFEFPTGPGWISFNLTRPCSGLRVLFDHSSQRTSLSIGWHAHTHGVWLPVWQLCLLTLQRHYR